MLPLQKFSINFFIAGFPKCGTTALYHYLNDNLEVFLPNVKEPHYFSTDLPGLSQVNTWAEYESLYRTAKPWQLKGDASASTVQSAVAVDTILEAFPSAKFLVLLRDPASAARSFHSERLFNLSENEPDFEMAWRLQAARAAGSLIPDTCREPALLQYSDVFNYERHLTRFLVRVPESQRLVLVYEEFFAAPRENYLRVQSFLGVNDDGRTEFATVNAQKSLRSRRLATLHRRVVKNNGYLYRKAKFGLSRVGIYPSHVLAKLNRRESKGRQVSEEFMRELRLHFQADVEAVEAFLGREIKLWRQR